MIFSPDQVSELLRVIQYHHVLFSIDAIGADVLSTDDIHLLLDHGVDVRGYKVEGLTQLEQAFHFGRLAAALGNYQAKSVNYEDFKAFVQRGGHRPLSEYEKEVLRALKFQSFQAVKGLGNRISADFTQIIGDTELQRRNQYEKILREELSSSITDRKSISDIVRELGRKTGDWDRDLGRLVETEMQNAHEEGRAVQYEEKYGRDVHVYKDVFDGACRHCIRLYLTNGIGSEPRIFKLSELRANGTNIGRKVAEWKAVLGTMHPFCRCMLNILPRGFVWDADDRAFSKVKEGWTPKHEFTVGIKIGDKKYTV